MESKGVRLETGSRLQVLVIGREKVIHADPTHQLALREAYRVGQLLAQRGFIVLTGGLGGVMDAVARGVADAGGVSVGIIPVLTPEERQKRPVSKHLTVCIDSGLEQRLRIPMLVRSCHAVIVISGGTGTWLEAAFALAENKVIITIPHTGDAAAWLTQKPPFEGKVLVASNAEDAVRQLIETVEAGGVWKCVTD